jgi:thioredoxin-like negative regulator of GroEL
MLFITQNNNKKKQNSLTSFIAKYSLLIILCSLALLTNSKIEKQAENKPELNNFESRIIELDDSTFPTFNRTNSKFYLYFYESNCKKCEKFSPKYAKSSFLSQDQFGVKFAQVNLDKSPKLREHYSIQKVPEVLWANYEEEDFHEYPGRLAPKSLLKFINSQLNYTSEELINWEQLEQKRKLGKYLVFAGDIQMYQKAYERLVKVAKDEDIDVIMWTKSPELLEKFGVASGSMDAVLINKKKKNAIEIAAKIGIDESTPVKEIERLMEIYERKPYAKLDEYSLLLSVENNPPTPTLFLVYSAKNKTQSDYNVQISKDLDMLSRKYRTEYHFMNVSVSSNLAMPLLVTFNISYENVPVLVLINDNKQYIDDVDKYVFPADKQINEQNVEQFLSDFKAQKLPKAIFSDALPENSTDENGIFNLVGYNFENSLFRNTDKDIALLLYSEFSYVNQEISERFVNVVNKLKNNANLLFAKANPLFNEIRNIQYDKLPTLFIIKGKNYQERIKNVIECHSEIYDMLGMIEFIKGNVENAISNVEFLNEEDKIIEAEKDMLLEPVPKVKEEDLIDFDENNSGLRRYVRHLMDEKDDNDDDDDDEPVQPKKKKGEGKKKPKDDL